MEVSAEFESLIRPPEGVQCTPRALAIHGLHDEDLRNSPFPSEVCRDFFASMGTGYALAGWNVCFDASFLRRLCQESNCDDTFKRLSYRHLDVQSVARACRQTGLIPYAVESLSDIAAFFGIARSAKHSALQDAHIALKVYEKLLEIMRPR
jgi:DNA polymerase III epsilon subunit-like protein